VIAKERRKRKKKKKKKKKKKARFLDKKSRIDEKERASSEAARGSFLQGWKEEWPIALTREGRSDAKGRVHGRGETRIGCRPPGEGRGESIYRGEGGRPQTHVRKEESFPEGKYSLSFTFSLEGAINDPQKAGVR